MKKSGEKGRFFVLYKLKPQLESKRSLFCKKRRVFTVPAKNRSVILNTEKSWKRALKLLFIPAVKIGSAVSEAKKSVAREDNVVQNVTNASLSVPGCMHYPDAIPFALNIFIFQHLKGIRVDYIAVV